MLACHVFIKTLTSSNLQGSCCSSKHPMVSPLISLQEKQDVDWMTMLVVAVETSALLLCTQIYQCMDGITLTPSVNAAVTPAGVF